MANASLYFKGNKKYSVGNITFDLLLSENHKLKSTITKHKIEDGSNLNDHIELQPRSGDLNGLISNFSINAGTLVSNRAQDAFDEMEKLMEAEEPVTVVTIMKTYKDMAISDVTVARTNSTGEAIALNISFEKIRIKKLQEVTIEATIGVADLESAINKQVAPELDIGETTPETNVEQTEERVVIQRPAGLNPLT